MMQGFRKSFILVALCLVNTTPLQKIAGDLPQNLRALVDGVRQRGKALFAYSDPTVVHFLKK